MCINFEPHLSAGGKPEWNFLSLLKFNTFLPHAFLLSLSIQSGGSVLNCPWHLRSPPGGLQQGTGRFQSTGLWEEGKGFGILINFLLCGQANGCPEMPGLILKGSEQIKAYF